MTKKTGPLAAVLMTAVLLGGCTVAGVSEPSASPTATATATDLHDMAAGTVLATGTFTVFADDTDTILPRPGVEGAIEVYTDDGRLTVSLLNLEVGQVQNTTIVELNALDSDATAEEFRVATSYLGDSEVDAVTRQTFDIEYGNDLVTTDPSWMRTAVIWERVDGIGTLGRALATATLTWTVPDQRPDLAVADAGSGNLAQGVVHFDSAGTPAAYVVAPLDALETIAARFAITVEDLIWLNPMRGGSEAQSGETLNLSRYERGR
ncbi:LysM domain-containing protein [Cryobacterium adonitolivorans]|uniref:LysM domain-containing protein n=1 Tax=Cryobacterium adonitolivorans TaxID=1259189 RepID=A0A4R8W8Y9_9MICO|nr:LysM domain-containing protein [Cryobacterium adonitolivorans]TFC03166.1 LysM domain-containing protein [Cryobacterium adonitolivorans]